MDLVDFKSSERIKSLGYGGNAGRKIAVLHNGEPWLLKFPQSTKDFPGRDKANNHLPSYTTSPLSEYIGSKIYESLGIPVHEVMLGTCDGKVVVACKDFAVTNRLLDFAAIKNTVEESALSHGNSSRGTGEYLSEVLKVLESSDAFDSIRAEASARFWDMFVTDAFILNNDRNNGNWGLLFSPFATNLAPVFDNGNAFFNKKGDSLIDRQVSSESDAWNDARTIQSFYLDDSGKKIHPFNYLLENPSEECLQALDRFNKNLDMNAIHRIIDDIPCVCGDLQVITPARKDYYKSLLDLTYSKGLVPAIEHHNLGISTVHSKDPVS